MNDLMSVVDWSRAQFALTAMYHWLFVPLTLGLSVIAGIIETIYYKTGNERWKTIAKFWMTLFGINFAAGIATGIILEFEFGTNWSNYSWFVGDIFGAPLAIEGILAFFMESTFVAIMFFGWNKVSKRFHLTATWLTALGTTLSALWILVANAWMQHPVGMHFEPSEMRNVMENFWEVALSPVAINKFCHTVLSGWVLASVFVIGVCGWLLLKRKNHEFAISSIKVSVWVGIVGMLGTLAFGHGSAQIIHQVQPMKLAAMEGLYDGGKCQEIVAFGILNPDKRHDNNEDEFLFKIAIPYGLSILATNNADGYVPGINDLIEGNTANEKGEIVKGLSYQDRITLGKDAHNALRDFDKAYIKNDTTAMAAANKKLQANFKHFGYGYFNSPEEAIPNVAITFYSFHIMVILGGYLMAFLLLIAFLVYRTDLLKKSKLIAWLAILSIPAVWICSECGWITAEVGRQPWIIQDLMPAKAAVSAITAESVQTTFILFSVLFTAMLVAEMSIMIKYISRNANVNIEKNNNL